MLRVIFHNLYKYKTHTIYMGCKYRPHYKTNTIYIGRVIYNLAFQLYKKINNAMIWRSRIKSLDHAGGSVDEELAEISTKVSFYYSFLSYLNG